MILMLVFLVVGFLCLVKGADIFVDGACGLSAKLKISAFLVGLTVVAFGTSLPEAAVSITASVSGNNGISFGNVLGSNIFNTLVVIGFSACFTPVPIKRNMLKRDFPFCILVTVLLCFLCWDLTIRDLTITRAGGIVLLLLFVWFLYTSISNPNTEEADELPEFNGGMGKCILFILIGLAGVIIGGQLTVKAAKEIALAAGLSETTVGLTVVAVGTSLPELVTSITAARKGQNDIAMGNVIGSNIFNILFILGLSATISPMPIGRDALIDLAVVTGISIFTFVCAYVKKRITRSIGIIMILMYVAYTAFLLLR